MEPKITYTQTTNFVATIEVDNQVFNFTLDGVSDQPTAKTKLLQILADITSAVNAN